MIGAPQKLDLDGVDGARLESMAAKAAKEALQDFFVEIKKVKMTSEENAIPDCFPGSAVVCVLCRKD